MSETEEMETLSKEAVFSTASNFIIGLPVGFETKCIIFSINIISSPGVQAIVILVFSIESPTNTSLCSYIPAPLNVMLTSPLPAVIKAISSADTPRMGISTPLSENLFADPSGSDLRNKKNFLAIIQIY